jgi:hypothetical protein
MYCKNCEMISGISITKEDPDPYSIIGLYTKEGILAYPLIEYEGEHEYNECVRRLINDTIPSVSDITLFITMIQDDIINSPTPELYKKQLTVLRNVKVTLMNNVFLLFTKTKPFHKMAKDEVVEKSILLNRLNYELGYDGYDTIESLFQITNIQEPYGFKEYLDKRNKIKN